MKKFTIKSFFVAAVVIAVILGLKLTPVEAAVAHVYTWVVMDDHSNSGFYVDVTRTQALEGCGQTTTYWDPAGTTIVYIARSGTKHNICR